ncbi:Chaperonin GroEL (HSP60 family) [Seinonella peptonophila]|uniref:Chaperonin GroEL (HSP60 family) n=1 Tax=Seinonella peptonophila TaxID=112248 RepID=A0A1M4V8G1_9BACL|nr:TCP-1/cpn60 chaperonin family protein [Seinonella peptonophila]SHE65276.1 Chaperonin GroEL (HSP60 family) [Seinonella peptonophila]
MKFLVGYSEDSSSDQRVKAGLTLLQENVQAVKKVVSVIETTLGPKGLDVMLVDSEGNPTVTNAGATILSRMEVDHPVSRMLIKVAESQQKRIGDGTTTATLLAASIVEEGAKQILRGIPVVKVIAGIQQGIALAVKKMKENAYAVQGLEDDWLHRIAYTASRGYEDITLSVMDAVQMIGEQQLEQRDYRLSDCIVTHPNAEGIVFSGILVKRTRLHPQMPVLKEKTKVFVISDSVTPSKTDGEWKKDFLQDLEKLDQLKVGAVFVAGEVHPLAEEFFIEKGIFAVDQVTKADLGRLAEHTNAKLTRFAVLSKDTHEMMERLGECEEVEDDNLLNWVRVTGGAGRQTATILIGASTEEVIEERERICRDVASAVQAAVKGGFVPGGGAIELAIARDLELYADKLPGLERYGVSAVVEALYRPISQVVTNAGYNSLEKLELVKRAQQAKQIRSLGFDCDRGHVADMLEAGVVDPLLTKLNALATALEVSTAILRIHTIIPTKN